MITELILNGLFGIADFFLDLMPAIEWTVDTSAWQFVSDILSMVCWLLPMGHIRLIVAAIVAIGFFRLSISVIRALANLLPFIG